MAHATSPPPAHRTSPSDQPAHLSRRGLVPVIIAWLFVIFDGYDLIVYGTVQGSLMREWGIGPATAGTVGSLAFLGMMLGALVAGRLSDTFGRRYAIVGSGAVLSVFTAACALAPTYQVFGLFRFVAGLGLGGLVPTANALAADIVPARWRGAAATLMMSGVPVGGSIAALAAIPVQQHLSWHWMFAFALVPLAVLLPWAWVRLPRDRPAARSEVVFHESVGGFKALLRPPYLLMSVMFSATTIVTLMSWYGLGTWLPQLIAGAGRGFSLTNALLFTLALNLGAVAGSVVTAWAGDRFGTVPTGAVAALLAGGSLLALLAWPPSGFIYVILVLAGVGTHGTQCLVIAAISLYFPAHLRGTALGWGLGVGRAGAVMAPQVGGWLLAAAGGTNPATNFILFGACALAAAVGLVAIWATYGVAKQDAAPHGIEQA
jgi:AAHS family benzoate transporter-like MFS transporter